jgi:hypothetical protein
MEVQKKSWSQKKEKRISTIPCWILFLSLLEIQLLDADGVHEREEHRKEHKNRCYNRHKTPVVSKMMCYIVTDCLLGLAGDCDDLLQISILCHYEPIHCPCQWANPIVPDPPPRNSLENKKKALAF